MTAQDDDPVGVQAPRPDHAAQADGAVADDCHRLAGANLGGEGGVVARRHHVRKRQKRRHQRVVPVDGEDHQRPIGLGHAHRLTLAAADSVEAVPASVEARGVQSLATEDAGAVGPHERREDEVADLHGVDV